MVHDSSSEQQPCSYKRITITSRMDPKLTIRYKIYWNLSVHTNQGSSLLFVSEFTSPFLLLGTLLGTCVVTRSNIKP